MPDKGPDWANMPSAIIPIKPDGLHVMTRPVIQDGQRRPPRVDARAVNGVGFMGHDGDSK
jgi:hypothetical protein